MAVTGEGFEYLRDGFGLVFPYNYEAVSGHHFADKEAWDEYQWNPPQEASSRYPDPDPEASPKPSWEILVLASELVSVKQFEDRRLPQMFDGLKGIANVLSTLPGPVGKDRVHVGTGLSHMDGLHYGYGRTGDAGERFRPSILRQSEDHAQVITIWTRSQLQSVLDHVAGETDLAESARNMVHSELVFVLQIIRDYRRKAEDPKLTLRERQEAATEAKRQQTLLENHYRKAESRIRLIMDFYRTSDAFPTDLPTLRAVLIERLEAASMARIKFIRGAVSQQRIDMPAACEDMGTAEADVAHEEGKGQVRIERADTVTKAKAAYDKAVIAINGVKARRTPVFHKFLTATNSERIHGDSVTYKETSVKIRAQHPTWRESRLAIPGEVSMFGHVETNAEGVIPEGAFLDFQVPDTVSQLGEMDVTLSAKAGVRTEYRLTARSICGPSLLTVILDPPAKETPAS